MLTSNRGKTQIHVVLAVINII